MDTFARGRQVGPGELAQIRASQKPGTGSKVTVGISVVAIRDALAAGACPFCGETKYRNLGGHTYRSHGYSAAEVRELAGLLKGTPICSPDLSAAQSARLRGRRLPNTAYTAERKPRTYSEAGHATNVAKLARARQSVGGQSELARIAGAAAAARTAEQNRGKHEQARELWLAGHSLKDIASRVGLHSRTVRIGLERAGLVTSDGRTWGRTRAHKVVPTDVIVETQRRQAQELAHSRLARYAQLGGGWAAVGRLAAETGLSELHMRAYLRDAGAHVPDGRSVSPKRIGRVLPRKPKSSCSIEGCDRDSIIRTMCRMHYQRGRKGGNI